MQAIELSRKLIMAYRGLVITGLLLACSVVAMYKQRKHMLVCSGRVGLDHSLHM